ncbi:substrate-binding domain-containing protein [Gordonia sp. HY002]|uniref:ABC transporter substrate-binding protein n=1 Tax=Gordonia zhenghanii TaxID=2911516 RepID=UPI001EF06EB5|nr:extracellular solute-binding protein [Gordonia zhenghanii]MCF8571908.1 substrate-binding domain-containing protein [Gordonia zhenghanii]MCF8605908.1 substrate-binding domain-containing protein [Gordonia zhenghanii]
MRKFNRGLAVVAGAFAILTASACGSSDDSSSGPVDGSWEDVIAGAESEGSVMLYSSQKPANLEALEAAFEAKYPKIDMEFVRGTDPDINPKVETENKTGKGIADVHMQTDTAWMNAAAESGTYSTDLVGPSFRAADFAPDKSLINDRFAITSAAVFALGWNTNAVPEGLATATDVINPAHKGKIGIMNPTGIASYVDMYRYFAETYGEDYWNKIAALQPRVYPSALGVAQALTSGEIVAAPSVQPLVTEMDSGAPVDWKLAEKPWGTPWYTHALSVAPHPNAAQLLADFMVTREGQTALNSGYAAVLPDIPGAVARTQSITMPATDNLTPEDIQKYSQQWSELFQN